MEHCRAFPDGGLFGGFEQLTHSQEPWPESWKASDQTIEVVNQRTQRDG